MLASLMASSAVAQTPAAPTVIYQEDFQNVPGPSPVLRLPQYTGATGQKYTADPPWLVNCNGWVASFSQDPTAAAPSADCFGQISWNNVQQMSYALGSFAGMANPAGNYGISAQTVGPVPVGAPFVEFQTATNVPLSAANRFIAFSVDVAANNCNAAHPLLQFSLLNGAGTATPVGGEIDACLGGTSVPTPAIGAMPPVTVQAGTYTSNGAMLYSGSSIGVRMVNNQPSNAGNDHAFDNIRILDVTPTLEKSFSPASLNVGAPSTLTFTITNTSELAAKTGWSFTDNLPSGLVVANPAHASTTCSAGSVSASAGGSSVAMTGNLNAGQVSCTVSVDVTSSSRGSYSNCPSNVSLVGLNPPACSTVTFREADLEIVKSADPAPIVPGKQVTYSLKVTNKGPDTATNVKVTDRLPSAVSFVSASSGCAEANKTVTCSLASLGSGASHTFKVQADVASSADSCADLRNTATVTNDVVDPDLTNNSSTVCDFERLSDLMITKVASDKQVASGGQVMYTLVVKNNGPSDASGVEVSDPMASGLSLVSAKPSQGTCSTAGGKVSCDMGGLEAGGSAQVLVTATVTAPAGSCGPSAINNTGTVSSDNRDTDPSNNKASASICTDPGPDPTFDLVVTKTAASKSVYVGQPLKYTVTVTNKGPGPAPNAKVTDTLNAPASVVSVKSTQGSCTKSIPMTCQLGTIPAGGKVTITVTVKLRDDGCKQRNAASATGEGTDSNPANNLAKVDVCAKPVPLRLTKVADRHTLSSGSTVGYTIRVSNPTAGEAKDVKVCDKLPSGLVYVSSKAKAKFTAGQYCWTISTLGAHDSESFRITVRALGTASGDRVNHASAAAKGAKTQHAKDPVHVVRRLVVDRPTG